jgi:hypothetical protein
MPLEEAEQWKRELAHVRWIGGPPDAGKSTVTLLLESLYNVNIYRMDGHEREHIERADPERFPRNAALFEHVNRDETGFFESWVHTPPAEQATNVRLTWIERIPMICEDLQALPRDTICIAEGPGFYPDAIRPLLNDPHQAAWLIPTERFKRESHARREKSAWRDRTSNPDLALRNHIERDVLCAADYRSEFRARDFAVEIDGSIPAETIARHLAKWFGLDQLRSV